MTTVGTDIVGTVGTFSMSGSDIIPEIARDVTLYDLQSSPIITFFTRIGRTEQIYDVQWKWQEDQYDNPNTTCTTGVAAESAGVTQVVTLDVSNVNVGDVFYEPTSGQHFEVTAATNNPTTTTATILGVPSTSAVSAVAGTPLFIRMGNFMVEGGYYPTARGQRPVFRTNNVQLVTRSIAITNTMMNVNTYHGSQWDYDRQGGVVKFRSDMERQCLWGDSWMETRTQTTQASKVATGTIRSSRGIIPTIQTNIQNYSGALTEATLDSFLANKVWGTRFAGSMEKLALCGLGVLQDINSFAKDRYRILDKGMQEYGLSIQVYTTFGGRRLYIMEEREFIDNPSYTNTMLSLDPRYISLKRLGPSLMQVIGTKDPSKDEQSIVLRAEFGTETRFEKAHAILKH